VSSWTEALSLDALPPGTVKVRKLGGTPVALFRLEDGTVHAVDNRCPHEGYPLSQGVRSGCVLTCSWHNFKFDLTDGSCLKGDEAVASWPVRVLDGVVEVDLTPPDPTAEIARRFESLHQALWQRRGGQMARDAVRLLALGVSEHRLAAWVAAWDGRHAEWGASHALAGCEDARLQAGRFPGPRFVKHLIQPMELASEGGVRRPAHLLPDPIDPGSDPEAGGRAFFDAVEGEDADRAIGLLRGALARGFGRAELEPWTWEVVAAHHLGFGHGLIYQSKVWELVEGDGAVHAEDILCGHVRGIVGGTREEVLPAWAAFRERLAGVDLDATWAGIGDPAWAGDVDVVAAALVRGSKAEAFDTLQAAMESGAPLDGLVDALVTAAAARLLHFDAEIDLRADVQDGWLSVTHCFTSAEALRRAVARHRRPSVLRLLHFVAFMIHHHRVLDLDPAPEPPSPRPGTVAEALDAIAGERTDEALARARGLLGTPDEPALLDALVDLALSDTLTVPIVSVHVLKTAWAAAGERRLRGHAAPVLGVVRWLASPGRQRWTGRRTDEALAFVLEGRIPKLLAP
jgi:nitrite reductase/ring-hydroxylating ferredoxin subunit